MVVPLRHRGIRARSKDPSELAGVSERIGTNRGEGSQRDQRRDGCGSTPIDEDRWVGSFLARVVESPSVSRGPGKTVLFHEDTSAEGGRYVVDTEPKGWSRETKKKERNDPDPTLDWTMEDIGDEKSTVEARPGFHLTCHQDHETCAGGTKHPGEFASTDKRKKHGVLRERRRKRRRCRK